jgi:hypothetical protein
MTVVKSAFASIAFASLVSATLGLHAQDRGLVKVLQETRAPLEIRTIKGAPYSAQVVIESTQALADGNRIAQRSTGRVYRDSEGRVRREEDRPNGSPSVSIVDPVAGISYSLDTDNRVAWRTPAAAIFAMVKPFGADADTRQIVEFRLRTQQAEIGGARMAGKPLLDPGAGVEQHRDEELEPQTLDGVRATGHRRTTTIPAGAIGNELPITIVSEEWTAPELQILVMTHRVDPRLGESSYRLQNIVRVEPEPYLFQVPADYTIKDTGIHKMELER